MELIAQFLVLLLLSAISVMVQQKLREIARKLHLA